MRNQATESLVPAPVSVQAGPGVFRLSEESTLYVDDAAGPAGRALRRALGELPSAGPQRADLRIVIDEAAGPPHGYTLRVTPTLIDVVGADPAGAFYAVQTLRQLLPPETFGDRSAGFAAGIPCVLISDCPRLPWRGLMLDVARHFLPKEFVLRVIDLLAMHKLDVLHLHLTDDQGWRIEIPGYPLLTEIGAWRPETVIGHDAALEEWDLRFDGRAHGGFYTTEDLSEIVAYATERYVTVLPEVDMPGHMQAAIAAYPRLGNQIQVPEVRKRWNVSKQILNLEDDTLRFCFDVLTEVIDVFPGQYVHCGGDEVPKDEWRASAAVQRRLRELGLHDEEALQGWFTHRIAAFLAEHGRRLVGWDEILDAGEPPAGTVVMPWRGEAAMARALGSDVDVVETVAHALYFNYNQSRDVHHEPLAIGGYVPLSTVYDHHPASAEDARVMGAQAQLWTEYIGTPALAEYMLFPRLCAFAESSWRQRRAGSYDVDFLPRLRTHLERLDAMGVRYRSLDEANTAGS